jgi:hypothetical protein
MPSRTLTPDLLPSPESSPAAEPSPSAGLQGLRLVKVPDAAPPYDCEIHGVACPAARDVGGAGPRGAGLSAEGAGARPAGRRGRKPVRVPGTAAGAPSREASPVAPGAGGAGAAGAAGSGAGGAAGSGAGGAAGSGAGAGGAADVWPRQLAQVIVEILAGSRSPRQLVPLTTDRVRAQIGLLARSLGCDQQPRIRRLVTFRPAAGVLEMTVVVSFGSRSRALAMRFEHRPGRPAVPGLPARPARWLCTDLEAG